VQDASNIECVTLNPAKHNMRARAELEISRPDVVAGTGASDISGYRSECFIQHSDVSVRLVDAPMFG
jgi:hypothetical protein